jgi:putative ABC transport system permease protein
MLSDVPRDVRYAFRSLRKSAGLATVAIVTLALGIGANTAIFSVLEGVVLQPLPYAEPDRLAIVLLYNRSLRHATDLSYPEFLDWQQSSRSFQQIAAFTRHGYDLKSPGAPEHLDGLEVSSNFFDTVGVKPAIGRALSPDEDRTAGPPAVVISDRLWRERFGANPNALGRVVTLEGVDYTIVGVLPPGFGFDRQAADVYTAVGRRDPMYRSDRSIHDLVCVVRLRPGVSLQQARAEMNTVQEQIDELHPATERGLGVSIDSLKRDLIGDVGGTLVLLLCAVGLVLLIACANVANLLLARSAGRTREFAVRLALGATRGQIVRQVVTESVLLSLAGGALGLAIAKWGVPFVLAAAPGSIPRIENIRVNGAVLLFAFGVSMIVGIVFGLLPALRSSKTDVQSGLKEGGRGLAGGHQRTQQALVVVQIALAVVLLTAGSLLLRTIHNLVAVNPGFEAQHVITFQVGLSASVTNAPAKIRSAYQGLVERIRQIPGVDAADLTALVPMGEAFNEGPFWVGPHQPPSLAEIPRAIYYPTGPGYIRTMQIPLLRGRLLTAADNLNSEPVVLIDRLLARTYFRDQDPVGRTITIPHWGAARNVAVRVVGVVGHVEHYGLDGSAGEKPQIYYSFYQLPDDIVPIFRAEVSLAVRTGRSQASVMPAIRKTVAEAGSDQPIYHVRTMQELVSGSMARQRFPMLLLVAFAGLALVLAVVGTYGVMSYSTTRRAHEIGIRMALGAERNHVLRMVIEQGVRLAVTGVAIGATAALILARLVASFSHLLYGVGSADPLTFVGVSVALVGAVILACYMPARRAARFDPMVALRHE